MIGFKMGELIMTARRRNMERVHILLNDMYSLAPRGKSMRT